MAENQAEKNDKTGKVEKFIEASQLKNNNRGKYHCSTEGLTPEQRKTSNGNRGGSTFRRPPTPISKPL